YTLSSVLAVAVLYLGAARALPKGSSRFYGSGCPNRARLPARRFLVSVAATRVAIVWSSAAPRSWYGLLFCCVGPRQRNGAPCDYGSRVPAGCLAIAPSSVSRVLRYSSSRRAPSFMRAPLRAARRASYASTYFPAMRARP